MRTRYFILGVALALALPAFAQDVRNTYISVATQIADNVITLAKLNGLGTGIATALGVNVGTAGAPVINGGALGTPFSGVATNLTSIPVANATGTLPPANLGGLGVLSNALGGDVNLNNTANFFDGPSIAQGSTGTWLANGQVNVTDTALAQIFCKLWDGTTAISSATAIIAANTNVTLSMSGYLASPAGNIRISCRDASNTTGKIQNSPGGVVTNGGYIVAFRIQ